MIRERQASRSDEVLGASERFDGESTLERSTHQLTRPNKFQVGRYDIQGRQS